MWKWLIIRICILAMFICGLFLAFRAEASEYADFMLGVFESGKSSFAETKLLAVGYRGNLPYHLLWGAELGGWADTAGKGRLSSGYLAGQVGAQAGDVLVVRVMIGPSLITTPDIYLGGVFQFTEDLFIGITGSNGNTVGMRYKHFSSAGIEMPNIGRDFLGLEASFNF